MEHINETFNLLEFFKIDDIKLASNYINFCISKLNSIGVIYGELENITKTNTRTNVAFSVTKLSIRGNIIDISYKILSTYYGNEAKGLIKAGFKLFIKPLMMNNVIYFVLSTDNKVNYRNKVLGELLGE